MVKEPSEHLFSFVIYTNVALADLPRNEAVSIPNFGLCKKRGKNMCVFKISTYKALKAGLPVEQTEKLPALNTLNNEHTLFDGCAILFEGIPATIPNAPAPFAGLSPSSLYLCVASWSFFTTCRF